MQEDVQAERARVKRLLAPDYPQPVREPAARPVETPEAPVLTLDLTNAPPGPPPVPLRPGELVDADEAGIARLLALTRAGLLPPSPPSRRERSRTVQRPTESKISEVLRDFG
jgi:hypothetical protein